MGQSFGTCRFCGETAHQSRMVHYNVRHYAHHACYLKAGKKLEDLHAWQISNFPFQLLKNHGLFDRANEIIAAKNAAAEQREAALAARR